MPVIKRHQLTEMTSQPDHTYGTNSAEPDLEPTALKTLCKEYLGRLAVTADIATRTVLQAEDITGEWELQRKGRLIASHFGEVEQHMHLSLPVFCTESLEGPKQQDMGPKMKKWLDKHTLNILSAVMQILRCRQPASTLMSHLAAG